MARKPLDALALIAVGIRSLSVSAAAIGQLKMMVKSISVSELTSYMEYLTTLPQSTIRQWLMDYAQDHNIVI